MTSPPTAHLVASQTSLSTLQMMAQIHSSLAAQLSVIMPAFRLMITLTILAMITPTIFSIVTLIALALTQPHTLPHPLMHQLISAQQ